MGEHFKREKTKQFKERAIADYKKLKIPRLPLMSIRAYITIYQCIFSSAGRTVLSQISEQEQLLLLHQGGTSWAVVYGNLEVGRLSEQSASDLTEKAERMNLPDIIHASFGSASSLTEKFEINCQLPEAEASDYSTKKKN